MDLLEKGKQLTQQGKYEEALDALYLALENDKENADIHFYIGLCYSSLEEFGYAKYHYQIALSIDPNHQKTKLVWDGIKNYDPVKPPERSKTRAAAAKARRAQKTEEKGEEIGSVSDTSAAEVGMPTPDQLGASSKYKVTDDKWEQAFPLEEQPADQKMGIGTKVLLILIALLLLGLVAFFVYDTFALID